MHKIEKIEPVIFYSLLALWLVPVWALDFFVTGDGPCHLYNSKILLDWWQGVNADFYRPYYFLNTAFEPNWLYNLITMPVLAICGPSIAEKVFMTAYVLGFGLGFRFFISQINTNAKFLSTVGLLFCYHKLLMMGFMNNSISFALWFWVAGWWWKHRDDYRPRTLLITALLLLLLYAAHPMGLAFSVLTLMAMLAGLLFFESRNGWKVALAAFFERSKSLALSALPTIMLFAQFVFRRESTNGGNAPDLASTLESMARMRPLVTMGTTERDLAIATGILCWLVLAGAVALRIRERKWVAADGLLLFGLTAFYLILFSPGSFLGGLEVTLRMVMIPFWAMLFWSATAHFPNWSKAIALTGVLVIAVGFFIARWPIHRNASAFAKEIMSCDPHLKNPASVLVLNYDWAGQTPQGKTIGNNIWLFMHVDCYLGTTRSAAISDNYETRYWYFPTISHWETDMYTQTDKDRINFDNRPPRADMLSFKRRTGQELDYVLMISYRDEFKDHEYTKEIFSQLEQGYEKVHTSEYGRAILYKRKGI